MRGMETNAMPVNFEQFWHCLLLCHSIHVCLDPPNMPIMRAGGRAPPFNRTASGLGPTRDILEGRPNFPVTVNNWGDDDHLRSCTGPQAKASDKHRNLGSQHFCASERQMNSANTEHRRQEKYKDVNVNVQ